MARAGKIRGWEKFRDQKDWITYRSDKRSYANIIQYKTKYGWDLKIVDVTNRPILTKNIKTKMMAMKILTAYMKSHPNG